VNYLAHAWLSGGDEGVMVGNFIADHIRGNKFEAYPETVIQGIILHRAIDDFTDQHVCFRKTKRHFYQEFNRHSGILTDIYFDYLLARNFKKYTGLELEVFSGNAYQVYAANLNLIPETAQRFFQYVIKHNIYVSYASIEGISTVLKHLSHRIGHGVELDKSLSYFLEAEQDIQTEFDYFLSELRMQFMRSSGE